MKYSVSLVASNLVDYLISRQVIFCVPEAYLILISNVFDFLMVLYRGLLWGGGQAQLLSTFAQKLTVAGLDPGSHRYRRDHSKNELQ